MFDDSVVDQSLMDGSDMSMDLGNLSSIFGGGSGNKGPSKPTMPETIKEENEDDEDGRKSSMFKNVDGFDKMSKISDATSVFNQEQKQKFNSLFNDNFKEEDSYIEPP